MAIPPPLHYGNNALRAGAFARIFESVAPSVKTSDRIFIAMGVTEVMGRDRAWAHPLRSAHEASMHSTAGEGDRPHLGDRMRARAR